MNNEKMTIDLKGDKLLLGAHFHTLEDKTETTFKTEHLGEFARFVKDKDAGLLVMCGEGGVVAQAPAPDRYTKPVAVCTLGDSKPLAELLDTVNKRIPMSEFTEFLESFKRFTSQEGMALLDGLRNFKMKKVLDIQSTKDNRGNFRYAVSLESGGKDDFAPPATLVFAVPVWAHVPDLFTHTFELHFSVQGQASSPVMTFTLKSFDVEDRLQERKKEIVDSALAGCPQVRFWGAQDVQKQDDAWKYFSNPLPEGEAAKRQIEANNAYRGR